VQSTVKLARFHIQLTIRITPSQRFLNADLRCGTCVAASMVDRYLKKHIDSFSCAYSEPR